MAKTTVKGKRKKSPSFAKATAGKKVKSSEPSKPTNSPQTMEELLAITGYQLQGLKKGDVVEGAIRRVSPKEITVDIGRKTECVVIDRELETYKEVLMALKPGDKVICQVIVEENDRGNPVVSLRRNIFEKRWTELTQKQKSGETIEVLFKEPVRGGILVDYGGIRGYIPQSQLDSESSKQLDKLSGRRTTVKVVEVDQATNRLVFSQRQAVEGEALEKQKEILALVPVGESVAATITGVVPFGAFAKFTVTKEGKSHDVEGLIHISEIAWDKVDDPNAYLKVGDALKVKVVGVDEQTGKLTLSLKQLLPDPWDHVLDMFEKDSVVKGTVTRATPFGVFVSLSPGIEGLIHISKLAPGQEPKAGEEITCTIEEIKPDQRKVSLSMTLTEKPVGYR